jgi:hypothetical protein
VPRDGNQLGTTVKPGKLEVRDIDDTFCAAQLAFWNALERRAWFCVAAHHVASGTPVAAILRPARTPRAARCAIIRYVTKQTRIVWRGHSHYGRVEAMEWAEDHSANERNSPRRFRNFWE